MGALALLASKALKLVNTGVLADPRSPELRRAWEEHGATDRYPTLAEVRDACAEAGLSGVKVRRHLLWRYSLVWRKPIR